MKVNSYNNENSFNKLKKGFYSSMFFDEFVKRDLVTNKGLLLEKPKMVWAFNSGDTFSGNPKWLFVYINKYRKDIDAYWLCDNVETVDYVRSLGYKAYAFNAGGGIEVKNRAGVFVTEQVKEQIPKGMENAVLLNLYHGVGCKSIERKVTTGFLVEKIITKYIKHSNYYFNNMLFLSPSELMTKHFCEQVGVDKKHIIKAGYPRCIYQKYFAKIKTFNHNIIDKKKRDKNTKVAVYAPTYRDNNAVDLMSSAIPNMNALEKKLKENNILLIFKMHPFVVSDINYINIKKQYEKSNNFLFWDNNNDLYEVLDKIDLAIVDYSSIFYDFLAAGVKNFIRYFYDYENPENLRDFAFDCKQMTCGKICESFSELLTALDNLQATDSEKEDYERIYKLFWEYSSKDSLDKIIDFTLNFEPERVAYPTLYSFDIFDTIISRKGLHPHSIFYKVKQMLEKCELDFDKHFVENYVDIRITCEQNAREYKTKTLYVRKSDEREITLDEIILRMASIYSFDDKQINYLKNAEMQAEYEDCIGIEKQIAYIESLVDNGEDVVLISDMYLPKELIVKMLAKFSKKIAKLPLFLSSEYKVQKTTGKLFYEVYKSFEFYKYGKWLHHGDNMLADVKMPKKIGITPVFHEAPEFSQYENELVKSIKSYDAYLVAAKMARFRAENKNSKDYFCYAYASLMFVPYIIFAVKDAKRRKIDTLYFISRDGHHLKRIADIVIKKLGVDIKTKYIYGSRKAWRIPSFINEFDESFFLPFGNVASATNFKSLLKALSISYEDFIKIFPNLSYLKEMKSFSKKTRSTIISILSSSNEYKEYLLNYAKEKRGIIDEYFKQEMNFDEKFAFVEYWGRGYTQTCHTRLLQNVAKREIDVPYYYMRSIYPTVEHDVRYNYTNENTPLIFVEALFANIDYKSIEGYDYDENGLIVPIKKKADCDAYLLNALNERLPQFTMDFLDLPLSNQDSLGRDLLKFSLDYFEKNQSDEVIIDTIAGLIDSVGLFGDKREFAPRLTKQTLDLLYVEKQFSLMDITSSIEMSVARSDKEVKDYYEYLTVTKPQLEEELKSTKQKKYDAKAIDFNNKLRMLGFKNIKQCNLRIYKQFLNKGVENKAIFFGENIANNELYISLIKALKKKGFTISELPYETYYSAEQLKSLATAKYVFVDTENEFFSLMKFRKETKVIRLYKDTFPVNLFGVEDIEYGKKSDFRLKSRIYNANCDVFAIAGNGLKKVFEKSFKNVKKSLTPIGVPATDLYFDDEFKALAKQKLDKINTKGKRVVLYLPLINEAKKSFFDFSDIQKLKENLSDEYILVVKTDDNNFLSAYADKNDGFSYLLDKSISVREAISASDIIIGDYSSVMLESALAKKPIVFTGVYESEKCDIHLADIIKTLKAPVANDTFDVISNILSIENKEKISYNEFVNKYFSECDGNSAKKIISLL